MKDQIPIIVAVALFLNVIASGALLVVVAEKWPRAEATSTTWKGPVQFDCDRCHTWNDIPVLHAQARTGESIRDALEAAAEAEHFALTGCRGRVTVRGELPPELKRLEATPPSGERK